MNGKENSIFTSQLQLVHLHIANIFVSLMNNGKDKDLDSLISFLQKYRIDSALQDRCIEIASIAGSEYPRESVDIINKKYGIEQFTLEEYPSTETEYECFSLLSDKEWEIPNNRYIVLYSLSYVYVRLIAFLVENTDSSKTEDLEYIQNMFHKVVMVDIPKLPIEYQKIIEIIAPNICYTAATISTKTDPALNLKMLRNTFTAISNENASVSATSSNYFSQSIFFSENSTIDNLKTYMNNIIILYLGFLNDPTKREPLSAILLNFFGQLLSKFSEFRILMNDSSKKEPISAMISQLEELVEVSDGEYQSTIDLLALTATFKDKPIDFIFSNKYPFQSKLRSMKIVTCGKNYLPQFIYERVNTTKDWVYDEKTKENCTKCVKYALENFDKIIQYKKEFHEFIVQVSRVDSKGFESIMKRLYEKKKLDLALFFDEMCYFLIHSENEAANEVAKKIAGADDLKKYLSFLNIDNSPPKCVYKYTSLETIYYANTCYTKIYPIELFSIFSSYNQFSMNISKYTSTDIREEINELIRPFKRLEYNPYAEVQAPIGVKSEPFSGDRELAYKFITYVSCAYYCTVNEVVARSILTDLMGNNNYDIGNKALFGLEFAFLCNKSLVENIILYMIQNCLSTKYTSNTELCLTFAALYVLIPSILSTLNEQIVNNLESLIFIGLCQPYYETRGRALDLIEITADICPISKFYKENKEQITKKGNYKALYLFRSMLPRVNIDNANSLKFERVICAPNNLIYSVFFSAFVEILYEKDKDIIERITKTLENMGEVKSNSCADRIFEINIIIFLLITGNITPDKLNDVFSLINKTSEVLFAYALSNAQMKDVNTLLNIIALKFPQGKLAGAALSYTLSLDKEFCYMQHKELLNGFASYHRKFINYYSSNNTVPQDPSFSLEKDIFLNGPKEDVFLFSLFLSSIDNVYESIVEQFNIPPKGRYGLCRSIAPDFKHQCDNKEEFAFLFNLSSSFNLIVRERAEHALAQWLFFGKISEEEAKFVASKLFSELLSCNILSSHFLTLLPIFTDEAIHYKSRLFAICKQFSLADRTYDETSYTETITALFGKLLALGLTAIAFGLDDQRNFGLNLITCLCAGTFSQKHTPEETDTFVKELDAFRPSICGPYADVEVAINKLSEYLASHFSATAEMFISAIFNLESCISRETSSRKSTLLSNSITTTSSENATPIEKLLTLLTPWLNFNDLSKNGTVFKGVPAQLGCFTVELFLKSILKMKCANPLSSSVASVIACMVISSPDNALATFCNLLLIINKNEEIREPVLSALSLVLAVSPTILSKHIMVMMKVDAWYALRIPSIKKFFSFKKTIGAALEVLTELILEGSDDVLAQKHICLSFALIVYSDYFNKADALIKAIVHASKQSGSSIDLVRLAEQMSKGVIANYRAEQIQEWFSAFSESQLTEVKNMLLQWGLGCRNYVYSSTALLILDIIKIPLSEEEKQQVASAICSFSTSLYDFSNTKKDIGTFISQTEKLQLEKMFGIVIISSGLNLIHGSLNPSLLKLSCSFLVCSSPEFLPIYTAALNNISEAFENIELISRVESENLIDLSKTLVAILTHISSANMLNIVRRILCICFTEDLVLYRKQTQFIEFCLAPIIWNLMRDQSRYPKIFELVENTSLKYFLNTLPKSALNSFFWQASTDLSEEDFANSVSYLSKIIIYGETAEIQAAYIILSEMLDKKFIPINSPDLHLALHSAVSNTDEILGAASSSLLKNAIKSGCTELIENTSKKNSKFPNIDVPQELVTNPTVYTEGCFEDIKRLPKLIVTNDMGDVSDFITDDNEIQPFTSWGKILSNSEAKTVTPSSGITDFI